MRLGDCWIMPCVFAEAYFTALKHGVKINPIIIFLSNASIGTVNDISQLLILCLTKQMLSTKYILPRLSSRGLN